MDAKELIARYTHEVGRQLPAKQRADVQAELASLLQDMLEERAASANRPLDEALAVEVIRELGEPGEVARRYRPSIQHLVGPDYFPVFMLVVRVVVAVLTGLTVLAIGVALASSDNPWMELGPILLNTLPQYFGLVAANIGTIAVVFGILERVGARFEADEPAWDPRSLPAIEDPNHLNRGEAIASVVVNTAMLLLFNLAPNWINVLVIHDGEWGVWNVLAPEFYVHMPWLSVSWLIDIGLNLAVLRHGRWNTPARWAELASSIFGIIVLYRMITGGELVAVPFVTLFAKGILAIVLVVAAAEACLQLYRLLTGVFLRGSPRLSPPQAGHDSPSVK